MKLLTILMISLMIGACSNNKEKNEERMSREPLMYRNYIEEGGEAYLDEHRTDADNMYYRGYRGN